jgi:hypothetical protein
MGWRLGEVKYTQREPRYRDRCTNDPEIGVHFPFPSTLAAYPARLHVECPAGVRSALALAARWRVIPVYDVLIGRFVPKGNAFKETDPDSLGRPLTSNVLN